jgi:hypothetical protein
MEPVMDVRRISRISRTVGAARGGVALGGVAAGLALALVLLGAPAAGAQTTTTRAGSDLPAVSSQGTLSWRDATRSATLAIGVDPAQVVPTAPLRVVFTWTFEGPTPLGTSEDSAGETSCESVLGRTYTRTIADWRPVVYFGTSATLSDYRIGTNRLNGPWVAQATATEGEGHETVTPVRCDGATPIAKTVRTYDVTYATPEMPLARYALVTPDFGFPVWWQDGAPPIVETVPPPFAAATPTTTAGTTTTTGAASTSTTTADANGSTTTAATGSTTTTAGATTTTTAATSTTAVATTTATSTTTAPTTTTAPPAAGGPGSATGSGTAGGDDDPSALDQGRALLGAFASFLAVAGLVLAAWTLTPRSGRAAARRARRVLSGAALLALATVGLSLFVAAFDAPMVLGAAALVLSALGALALRARPRRTTLVGPGLSVADARRLLADQ